MLESSLMTGLAVIGATTTNETVKNNVIVAVITIVVLIFLSHKRG